MSNLFGSKSTEGSGNMFNSPQTFGTSTNINSNLTFGNPSQNVFGGTQNVMGNNNVFGAAVSNNPTFGTTTANPSQGQSGIFGGDQNPSPLGSNTGGFGTSGSNVASTMFGSITTSGGIMSNTSVSEFGSNTGSNSSSTFGSSTASGFSSNTASGFGSNTTSGFIGSTASAFGSLTGSAFGSGATGVGFGSITTSFGTSTITTSGFRTSTHSSNKGTSNLFGSGTGQGGFAAPISSGASTGFGKGNTASSLSIAVTSSGFGVGGSSSTFGNVLNPATTFGGNTNPATTFNSGQSTSIFGTTNAPATQAFTSNTSNSVFGQKVTSFSSTKQDQGVTQNPFSSGTATTSGIFGNTDMSKASDLFSKPRSENDDSVFGSKQIKVEGEKPPEPTETGLFGKPVQKVLFGKTFKEEKDKEVSSGSQRVLFQDEKEEKKIGRKRINPRESDDVQEKRGRNLFSRATAGVFGKEKRTRDGSPEKQLDRGSQRRKVEVEDTSEKRVSRLKITRLKSKEPSSKSGERSSKDAVSTKKETKSSSEEETPSRVARRRQLSVEEINNKVAISVKGIPAKFNKVPILRNHFKKYGDVKKVFPNVNKNMASVHFDCHASAENAKLRGRLLAPNFPPLQIFWSSHLPAPSKVSVKPSRTTTSLDKRSEKRGKSQWESNDVDDELSSMAGTKDIKVGEMRAVPRPKEDAKKKPDPYSQPHSPKAPGRLSPAPSPVKSSAGETGSFNALLHSVGKTVWEKKELLDLRDKLLRQTGTGDKKKSDLATAKAFTGTCPDMCPEKERYDRQETRRLSIYEMIPGTENNPNQPPQIDHRRAVKEYSRSSADQTEPLKHELRPEAVLMMTMTYLLREIADRGEEERWADWYDFLWNRTRGIRKDITQQQLCNQNVVELIEKCARFHIYCSQRLCEQDMMVFDSKINNENLTKCLQTLKEMYYDLAENKSVFCDNEAEFRSYMVLMNLNEGDTLREVQEWREDVRQSPDLRFALKVYSALNSHNYVRFFRLLHQASFLSSCIMHRYFTQVRRRALIALKRALGKNNKYPLAYLVKILNFETEEEAAEFCAYYGLHSTDGSVAIDIKDFVEPEVAIPQHRSITLIESKLNVPVGQIINGRELPELVLPEPKFSFDVNGKFVGEEIFDVKTKIDSSQADGGSVSTSGSVEDKNTQESSAQQLTNLFTNDAVKAVLRDIFVEVIDEYIKEIAKAPFIAQEIVFRFGDSVVEEWSANTQKAMIKDLCIEVIEEEKKLLKIAKEKKEMEELKRKEEERRNRIDRLSEEISDDYISEVCEQEVLDVSTSEYKDIQTILKKERIERCNNSLTGELVTDVVSDLVDEIAADVYEVNVVQRLEHFRETVKIIQTKRCGLYFQKWKITFQAQIKLKRAMLAFPCGPAVQNSKAQLHNLLPERIDYDKENQAMLLSQNAKLTLKPSTDLEKENLMLAAKLSLAFLHQQLRQYKSWQPLDITRLLRPQLLKMSHRTDSRHNHLSEHLTWKLMLSLPDEVSSSTATSDFCFWLKNKFKRGAIPECNDDNYKGEILSLYNTTIDGTQDRKAINFGFCVQCLNGTLEQEEIEDLEDRRVLLGTSGVIFVLPVITEESDDEDNVWLENQLRLARIMQAKPVCPPLPLAVISATSPHHHLHEGQIMDKLNINSYIQDDLISDVYFMSVFTGKKNQMNLEDLALSEKIGSCVKWLGSRIPELPSVQSKPLQEFVNDVLLEEYFTPVLQDLRSRKKKKLLHQGPEVLLGLYNSVVNYLKDVISSPLLLELSWPVPEFTWFHHDIDLPPVHWNTKEHLDYLNDLVCDLRLPGFTYQDEQTDSWQSACQDVWSYITQIVEDRKGSATVDLVTRVKRLLKRVEDEFEDTCYLVEGEDECQPTYINMPWTDIIQSCIDFRMRTLNIVDPNSSTKSKLKVFYTEETFCDFEPPASWISATITSDVTDNVTLETTIHRAVEKVKEEEIMQQLKKQTEMQLQKPIVKVNTRELIFSNSIINRIQKEREQADDFEKYLRSVVQNEDVSEPMEYCDVIKQSPEHLNESLIDMQTREYYDSVVNNGTISQKLETLKDQIESNKMANRLFEEKLEHLLNS